MLNYPSLMCDEAGGCDHSVGNFRGVCPTNGRQQIMNRKQGFSLPFASSSGSSAAAGTRSHARRKVCSTQAEERPADFGGTPWCVLQKCRQESTF